MSTANETEAVAQTSSVKEVPLEISQNLQENTWARVSFLVKLQALGRTPLLTEPSGGCF